MHNSAIVISITAFIPRCPAVNSLCKSTIHVIKKHCRTFEQYDCITLNLSCYSTRPIGGSNGLN